MPKAYIIMTGILSILILLFLLDKSAYVKELDSREISSDEMDLPGDEPSRKNTVLSANMINGVIVSPGSIFSFNDIVGPRTLERGFAEGLSILQENGKSAFVRDVGGGICRTSTSLHQAVLKAGLEVRERHDHVIPVEYAGKGQDAALLYGKQDYRFRNNRDNPVKVVTTVRDSKLYVSLEEKVQLKIEKHNILRLSTMEYYRDRVKAAYRARF